MKLYNQQVTQQKNQQSYKKNVITTAIISTLVIAPSALRAEDVKESDIEVVTVTAQKRVQNILKVPVTVGTISQKQMKESGAVLLSELDKFIPGFVFNDGTMTQDGIKMRGIESPGISVGGDPSSASFFDDVYMPQAAHNIVFSDMARVEVLKGPQGTLFGRNAAMGVVNMVPNSPHADLEGFAKATVGTDNLQRYELMGNMPLTDNVYLRANYLTTSQDGIVDNISKPSWNANEKIWDLGEIDHQSGRVALFWDISSKTNFQISYDWDDLNQAPSMAVGISEYSFGKGEPFLSQAQNDVTNGKEMRDMYGVIAKLNHEFNDEFSMKYVLSYRDWETFNRQDEDGTEEITRYFDTINNEDSNIMYTELQLNYVSDKINAVTGFSYSKEDVNQRTYLSLMADTASRLVTGGLNDQIYAGVEAQIAGAIGGATDAHAEAAFGPDVTFDRAVSTMMQASGVSLMDHMWDPEEWAGALNTMGFADGIMGYLASLGLVPENTPLTADIIRATGDATYDVVAQQVGMPEVFGPSYSGQIWRESIYNTGDFTNWGIYGDIDYSVNDKWNVIAGLRYSRDEKDFTWFIPRTDFAQVRPGVNNLLFSEVNMATTDSWDKVTGRLVNSYQIDDDQMVFFSYSTGYKSGGFDSLTPSMTSFEPEDTTNYELGYKAVLWDSLVVNVSAYYLELENLQRSISSKTPDSLQAAPTIINEDREITGLEFDLRWSINSDIKVGIVSEIRSTDNYSPDFYNGEGTLIEAQKTSNDAAANYTLMIDWMPDFGVGTSNFHLDYVYEENINDQEVGLEEYKKGIEAYFIDTQDLNARFSWTTEDDTLEIGLWGKNLLDKRYMFTIGGFAAEVLGVPHGRINRGLEAGIDVKYSF